MAFNKQRLQKLESKVNNERSETVRIVVSENPEVIEVWFGKKVVYLDRTAAEKYSIQRLPK